MAQLGTKENRLTARRPRSSNTTTLLSDGTRAINLEPNQSLRDIWNMQDAATALRRLGRSEGLSAARATSSQLTHQIATQSTQQAYGPNAFTGGMSTPSRPDELPQRKRRRK